MRDETIFMAVNLAILTAHRLGEPRVLELTHDHILALRRRGAVADWGDRPAWTYRGLRVAEREGSPGRVLAWDRARETEMVQPILWPARAH
jgi:hypothetical protein